MEDDGWVIVPKKKGKKWSSFIIYVYYFIYELLWEIVKIDHKISQNNWVCITSNMN